MAETRDLCDSRGIKGAAFYSSMAGYREAGRLTAADRRSLDRLATTELRMAWLTQKYGTEAIARVALADYDRSVR